MSQDHVDLPSLYLKTEVSVEVDGRLVPASTALASHGGPLHVITAWNPGDERPSREENEKANNELRNRLSAMGHRPVRALGADPDSDYAEESLAVVGLSRRQAKKIGRDYRQVAIFEISHSTQAVVGCFSNWIVSRPFLRPSAAEVGTAHKLFNGGGLKNWKVLIEKTSPELNLDDDDHISALLVWLNSYGCRMKRNPDGAIPSAANSIRSWWEQYSMFLSTVRKTDLSDWDDRTIALLAEAFSNLSTRPSDTRRRIGPTAASKILMALSPSGLPAWDNQIAAICYSGAERWNFEAHLLSCRALAREIFKEGEGKDFLSSEQRIGQAKIIDEWLYKHWSRGDI